MARIRLYYVDQDYGSFSYRIALTGFITDRLRYYGYNSRLLEYTRDITTLASTLYLLLVFADGIDRRRLGEIIGNKIRFI
jgi:hypothetical protein